MAEIIQLSPHFALPELARTSSRQFIVQNLKEAGKDPILANLTKLAVERLEVVRALFDRPIRVNSGYRCPALNRAVGGSPGSQHMSGDAADVTIPGVDLKDAFEAIRAEGDAGRLLWGQLILECYDPKSGSGWIHISNPTSKHKNEVLVAKRSGNGFAYTRLA